MKPLVAVVAALVALTVGAPVRAQTPEIDGQRARAEQGDVDAQFRLGIMYDNGKSIGVPQDDAEAVRWYRLAADQGHMIAQTFLGNRHLRGDGVPKDDAEAMRWWRLAAEQGHADSQYKLAPMHEYGLGVPQNYVEAAYW